MELSVDANKYNNRGAIKPGVFTKYGIPNNLANKLADDSNRALATNTKSNYNTVKNNITRCEEAMNCDLSLPWDDIGKTLHFLAFLLYTRKVTASTANCQLSGVRMAHLEIGLDAPSLRPPIVNMLLEGHEHWENVTDMISKKAKRTPVTKELMLYIKRALFEADWNPQEKFIFWATATVIWCGSMRIHEALSRKAKSYDISQTLLAKDVSFITTKVGGKVRSIIKLKLKAVKESKVGAGTVLEIFANNSPVCPQRALDKYLNSKGGLSKLNAEKPFFLKTNGTCYTGDDFNKHLMLLTHKVTDGTGKIVRSHSFRSGIPSELCKLGATDEEICGTGRWSSDAYKLYCKLPRVRRMNMADSVCLTL